MAGFDPGTLSLNALSHCFLATYCPMFLQQNIKIEVARAFSVLVGQIEAPTEIVSEFFQP